MVCKLNRTKDSTYYYIKQEEMPALLQEKSDFLTAIDP